MELEDQIFRLAREDEVDPVTKLEVLLRASEPVEATKLRDKISSSSSTTIPHADLDEVIRGASLEQIKHAIAMLHGNVLEWRQAAIEQHTRAEREAVLAGRIGRRYFYWGLALSIPIGVLGSFVAWLLGIS